MTKNDQTLSTVEKKSNSYQLFNEIAPTYDFLNHLLSFGIDIIWRKRLIGMVRKSSITNALDLACGTGDLSIGLTTLPTLQKVTGIDLSKNMIEVAKIKTEKKGLTKKISFFEGNAENIPTEDNLFDLVTISFGIRNFPAPLKSLIDIKRVLKSGGRVLIIEFSLPTHPILKKFYLFYLRKILPLIGNAISKHALAYTYLNQTIETFPYGDNFIKMMQEAGLQNCSATPLTFGIATIYSAYK